MKHLLFTALVLLGTVTTGCAQRENLTPATLTWPEKIARTYLTRHPGAVTYDTGFSSTKWTYEQGLMLEALFQMGVLSGDTAYQGFVRRNLEQYIDADGVIRTYKKEDYNLDNISPGRAVLNVYRMTNDERYRKAADILRDQLRKQPRTGEGGFWHKKIYPNQMWLDGLYMAEPFYARYAVMFNEPDAIEDVIRQFQLIVRHTRDSVTGLYYHGWDESRKERWSDPVTGRSPSYWGRSMGWMAMALVDVCEELPDNDPRQRELIPVIKDLGRTLLKYRDSATYVWFQVVDQGSKPGNYLESSASCMFTYFFAKGARKGYLHASYADHARESFSGIIKQFVTTGADGTIDLHETCKGAGLGGTPYRDGSFDYYTRELRRTNDPKGIGPFLIAAIEIERAGSNAPHRGEGK